MSLTELPEIPGGWTSQTINLGPRSIQLTLPAVPDDFLDDPNVLKASRESDYMPYWAYLWPASTAMARLILSESWPEGTRALEIGCGVGLTGVAGLAAGLDLTFSDYDSTSVESAQRNAALNGFSRAAGVVLDWRKIASAGLPPFDVIIGCEVVYELGNHALVLDVLDQLMKDDGVCWIGDPGRHQCPGFCKLALSRGYKITLRDSDGQEVPLRDGQLDLQMNVFRLLVLTKATAT